MHGSKSRWVQAGARRPWLLKKYLNIVIHSLTNLVKICQNWPYRWEVRTGLHLCTFCLVEESAGRIMKCGIALWGFSSLNFLPSSAEQHKKMRKLCASTKFSTCICRIWASVLLASGKLYDKVRSALHFFSASHFFPILGIIFYIWINKLLPASAGCTFLPPFIFLFLFFRVQSSSICISLLLLALFRLFSIFILGKPESE